MSSDTLAAMTNTHGYSDKDYSDAVASGHVPAPEQPKAPKAEQPKTPEHPKSPATEVPAPKDPKKD